MPQAKPYCTLSRTTPPFAHRKAGKNLDTAGNVRRARNSRRRACVCSSWALEEWKYASVIALGRPCRHRCRRRRLLPSSCRTLTDSPRARGPSRRKLAGSFHRFSGCSRAHQPACCSFGFHRIGAVAIKALERPLSLAAGGSARFSGSAIEYLNLEMFFLRARDCRQPGASGSALRGCTMIEEAANGGGPTAFAPDGVCALCACKSEIMASIRSTVI
jgi:hypothetical protein